MALVVASAAVHFLVAPRIARSASTRARRGWLCVSLATNLGLLAVFKYTPFAVRQIDALLALRVDDGAFADWVVPVGISFYTFQTLSYTIDVYRGRLAPTRSLRDFAPSVRCDQ